MSIIFVYQIIGRTVENLVDSVEKVLYNKILLSTYKNFTMHI